MNDRVGTEVVESIATHECSARLIVEGTEAEENSLVVDKEGHFPGRGLFLPEGSESLTGCNEGVEFSLVDRGVEAKGLGVAYGRV